MRREIARTMENKEAVENIKQLRDLLKSKARPASAFYLKPDIGGRRVKPKPDLDQLDGDWRVWND